LAALLTDPVGAGRQSLDCRVDLSQLMLDLLHKRCDLRPLERDRRTLWIMLVVSIGVPRGRYHFIEVAGQSRKPPKRVLPFRLEQFASLIHPSILTRLAAQAALDHLAAPRTDARC
jgi:hypothetical protein